MSPTSTRAGRYFGPPGDATEYWLPRDLAAWEAAWAKHQGTTASVDLDDIEDTRGGGVADMSPEAIEARRIAKAREAEALAYARDYRGTWGLPLDIRADRRWGTKYHHLSERQVEALLQGKARDASRVAVEDDLTRWLRSSTASGGFIGSLKQQLTAGRSLSPRQREVAERIRGEESGQAMTPSASAPVTEGMYQSPEGVIFKVQKAKLGSGNLYAKRLVVDEETKSAEFVYEKGGIRRINPDWRMSIEQAEAFGQLYGICCVCGRDLTDETSIARGIGPVCAKLMVGGETA